MGAGVSGGGTQGACGSRRVLRGFYAGSRLTFFFVVHCIVYTRDGERGALDKVRCGYGVLPGYPGYSRYSLPRRAAPDTLLGI